ncbi:MAG: hypothetical protein R3C46_08555 [Hyphomonadaceae bacterium]
MFYWSKLLAPFTPRAGRVGQMSYIFGFALPFAGLIAMTWVVFVGAPGLLGAPGYYAIALGWTFVLAMGDAYNIRRWRDLGNSAALYKLLRPGVVLLPLLAFILQFLIPAHLAMAGDVESLVFLMGIEFGGFTLQPAPLALLAITLVGVTGNILYLSLMPGQVGPNAYGPDPRSGGLPIDAIVQPGQAPADAEDDPVKRALVAYRQQQAASAAPAAPGSRAMQPAPTGAFGKKRR